jgi:tRNA modification GTPase
LPWHQPSEVATALRDLLATERLGHAFWRPPRVAVVGPTNAGKSTLFNALAREERMIVSPQPGTTRDAVSAEVAIGGLPVWLTDTAGEREPGSIIEVEAVARSRSAAAEAALVLLVFDGSAPPPIPLATLQAAIPNPQLLILNKADLGLAPWTRDLVEAIEVSAIRGTALDELCRRIVETLVGEARYEPGRPVLFTLRQAGLVREALSALEAGDLDAAQAHVSEIL